MTTTYDSLAGDESTVEILSSPSPTKKQICGDVLLPPSFVSSPSPAKKQRCGDIPLPPSLVEEDPRSKIKVYEYDLDSDVEDDSNGMHEMTEKEYDEYNRQIEESEGFDVMYFPRSISFGTIEPLTPNGEFWDDLKTLLELALKEYNKKEGTNLQFVKAVKANAAPCAGLNYYITFDVKDADAVDGSIIEFQACVYDGINITKVKMCRPKSFT